MKNIIKLVPVIDLLVASLTYTMGAGIAHYLGAVIELPVFILGFSATITVITTFSFILELFRLPHYPSKPGESPQERKNLQTNLFLTTFGLLTLFCAFVTTMLVSGMIGIQSGLILIVITISLVVYSSPPFRLSDTGFGELIFCIVLALFIPAFSFLLYVDEFHRLIPMLTFPILLMSLSWQIAENFITYSSDQKFNRRTMLTNLTWQRAVPIHHVLILASFFFIALAPLLGFSWRLLWPVFISLPFVVLQILWLNRITHGRRPVWKFFRMLIRSNMVFFIYLIAFTFWFG